MEIVSGITAFSSGREGGAGTGSGVSKNCGGVAKRGEVGFGGGVKRFGGGIKASRSCSQSAGGLSEVSLVMKGSEGGQTSVSVSDVDGTSSLGAGIDAVSWSCGRLCRAAQAAAPAKRRTPPGRTREPTTAPSATAAATLPKTWRESE